MRKTLATLLFATAIAVPFAQAEDKPITVDLTYDRTLLETEAGAKTILASLQYQATEACSYPSPILGTPKVDTLCRDELINKAVDEIRRVSLQDGTNATYVFASLEASPAQ